MRRVRPSLGAGLHPVDGRGLRRAGSSPPSPPATSDRLYYSSVVRGSLLTLGAKLGIQTEVVVLPDYGCDAPVEGVNLGGQVGHGEIAKVWIHLVPPPNPSCFVVERLRF